LRRESRIEFEMRRINEGFNIVTPVPPV
jgi:hypothetical protein